MLTLVPSEAILAHDGMLFLVYGSCFVNWGHPPQAEDRRGGERGQPLEERGQPLVRWPLVRCLEDRGQTLVRSDRFNGNNHGDGFGET